MDLFVDGVRLAFTDTGSGRPLLFLHAFPLDSRMWDPQAALDARILRLDARGFGGSGPSDGPLTMERIADDAAALLDLLEIERAIVCGLSMGGYAALAFARRHASRLEGLVLADTRAAADTDEARAARRAQAAQIARTGSVALRAMIPRLLGDTTRRERPDLEALVGGWIDEADPDAVLNAIAGLAARPDSTPTLASIHVPTLALVGNEDVMIPVAEADRLREGIRGARLTEIRDAGHLSNLENPHAFNEAVSSLLAELR